MAQQTATELRVWRDRRTCGTLAALGTYPMRTDGVGATPAASSGLDGLALAVAGDLDLAWFGLLGDRNRQPEHSGVIFGVHPVRVQVVPQDQLPAEDAPGALGGEYLGVLGSR